MDDFDLKKRSRGWVFTLNNPTEDCFFKLHCLIDKVRYIVYGDEFSPDTGTYHLQGFVYFDNPRTGHCLKKHIPRAHFAKQRGTCREASEYCKKEGSYVEFGDLPMDHADKGEAEKDRWKNIRELCNQRRWSDLPDNFVCMHPNNPKRIRQLYLDGVKKEELPVLENYWFWGSSGTGKSRSARQWCRDKGLTYYVKMLNKWWDGYEHEDVVIIEEWSPENKDLVALMKVWTDHYPFRAEVKGDSMEIRPKHFIVTSNYEPSDLWPDARDLEPILRRFNVKKFV